MECLTRLPRSAGPDQSGCFAKMNMAILRSPIEGFVACDSWIQAVRFLGHEERELAHAKEGAIVGRPGCGRPQSTKPSFAAKNSRKRKKAEPHRSGGPHVGFPLCGHPSLRLRASARDQLPFLAPQGTGEFSQPVIRGSGR